MGLKTVVVRLKRRVKYGSSLVHYATCSPVWNNKHSFINMKCLFNNPASSVVFTYVFVLASELEAKLTLSLILMYSDCNTLFLCLWLMLSVNYLQIQWYCGSSRRTLETRLETWDWTFFFNVRIMIKMLSYSATERQMLMIAVRKSSPNWWLGD